MPNSPYPLPPPTMLQYASLHTLLTPSPHPQPPQRHPHHTTSIPIKTPPTLPPQPPRLHHLPQPHTRPILTIPQLRMQHLHNRQTRIQPNKIRQPQRSHRHIRPVLHNRIDILRGPDVRLEADDRFVDVGHEDAVGEEARCVCGAGGGFPQAHAEVCRG